MNTHGARWQMFATGLGAVLAGWLLASSVAFAAVPLYDNLGKHTRAVTTTSSEAQRYFDQGLRLVYGFNHDEAIAAFKQAAEIDPNCAMCYWGAALAMGPNINLPMDLKTEPAAAALVQKAQALSATVKLSDVERALIDALAKRYSASPGASRAARDVAYADAMRGVARRFANDTDVATLFAEALMDLQPWDYWSADGQPKGAAGEIVGALEGVLLRDSQHPGACHYYIHAVEASREPQRALACAQRLPSLMPGAGHLVHMPAHIYMRLGMYDEAVAANVNAAHVDHSYIQDRKPVGIYPMMYYPHSLHFLYAAAAMAGRSNEAIQAARDTAAQVPLEVIREIPPFEMFAPTPLFALARFGKWEDILKEPAPAPELAYTTGMWHYARGLAFAATDRLADAQRELSALGLLTGRQPGDHVVGLNSSKALLQIATNVLSAELAQRNGRTDAAVRALELAIRIEDRLTYDEPPPWYQPVRQVLGAVLLQAGRTIAAEEVYREDLARNPDNGWSLYGLKRSLELQKKTQEIAVLDTRFKRAWKRADVTLTASRID